MSSILDKIWFYTYDFWHIQAEVGPSTLPSIAHNKIVYYCKKVRRCKGRGRKGKDYAERNIQTYKCFIFIEI